MFNVYGWIILFAILILLYGLCEDFIHGGYKKQYWTSSVLSTINLDRSCYVKVHEEIVMGFKGDFGRIERAICHGNLPFQRPWFRISDLIVYSNYSSVERTELKESGKDCYSIHSFLKERTPSDEITFVKLTLSYSMKGPLAIYPNADPEGMPTFEFGWNMKFKKGNIQKAIFRVEYPSELYYVNNENFKKIGKGQRRIEKHFSSIQRGIDMQLNLKGNVKSPDIEICHQPPYPYLIIFSIFAFIGISIYLYEKFTRSKVKVDDTAEGYDYSGYYSDGGISCGSGGGCDAD